VKARLCVVLGILLGLQWSSACAALWEMKPFPAQHLGATIKVDNAKMSRMSLPSGNYIARNGQIVVFNYFGGTENPPKGGAIGLTVDMLRQNSQAKRYAPIVDTVTFDMRPATEAAIAAHVAPMLAGQAAAPESTLTISPFVFFVQEKPGVFRVRALLRARLSGKGGKKLWQNDYYCPATEVRPLEGDESWFAQDRYAQAVTAAIERTAPVLGRDLLGQLVPRRTVLLAAGRKWDTWFEFPAAVLEESDDWLVVRDTPDGKKLAGEIDLIDKHSAEIKPFDPSMAR
jgi:hypothetical protein